MFDSYQVALLFIKPLFMRFSEDFESNPAKQNIVFSSTSAYIIISQTKRNN